AGLDARLSEDILLEIWRKFLVLSPMAALSAMTRVPLERIRNQPDTWRLAEVGMREVVAVAHAEGIRLSDNDIDKTLAFVRGMPAKWKASLGVDLKKGRGLEVDWFAGRVCRLGDAAKIDTPFHRVALGALKPHAAGTQQAEPHT